MTKIKEIFQQRQRTYSFELFPPKTDQGLQNLLRTITELTTLKPDFISCTYGAGGGSRDKTLDVVQHIQDKHRVTGLAHLTCILHTKEEIKNILQNIRFRGIENVRAEWKFVCLTHNILKLFRSGTALQQLATA